MDTNQIIDGITEKLSATYGDDSYKYYTEQVKQGLRTPCFIVSCVTMGSEQMLGDRYKRNSAFSVTYLPKSTTEAGNECLKIQNTLFDALEYITVGGNLKRGTDIAGRIVDGALVCTVNYDMFIRRVREKDTMITLQVKSGSG